MSYGGQQNRTEWYDRNPVQISFNYSAVGVAPHALTTRATYTVPAGKKFYMQFMTAVAFRDAAAAPEGLADVRVRINDGVGTPALVRADHLTNVLGTPSGTFLVSGAAGVLLAGIIIEIVSQDLSTGGSMTYRSTFSGITYDA